MEETIPLIGGINIGEWHSPEDCKEAFVAWRGANAIATVGVYVYTWENPHPDTLIEEIDFVSSPGNPILGLIAVTAEQ